MLSLPAFLLFFKGFCTLILPLFSIVPLSIVVAREGAKIKHKLCWKCELYGPGATQKRSHKTMYKELSREVESINFGRVITIGGAIEKRPIIISQYWAY